jgi:hypothetical protein
MEWLVNVFVYPGPDRRLASPEALALQGALMASYSKHVTPVHWGHAGDWEDFFEQAYRLDAALEGFGPRNVWVQVGGGRVARNAATGDRRPVEDLAHLPIYGAQPGSRGHFLNVTVDDRLADGYAQHRAFLANAGRPFRVAGYATTENDVWTVVRQMNRNGVTKFFVKVNPSKTGMFSFDLPPAATREDISRAFMDDASWAVMHMEGKEDAFFVQGRVPMEYEYRLFVVDHTVVTGAGCIEEHTPLDNQGDTFDPRVRRDRAARSSVISRPDVVARLTAFGKGAAGQLAAEAPALGTYVIDVALGPSGEPLVIELNGMLNAGLYASRPTLITTAMAAAPHTSMPTRPNTAPERTMPITHEVQLAELPGFGAVRALQRPARTP